MRKLNKKYSLNNFKSYDNINANLKKEDLTCKK